MSILQNLGLAATASLCIALPLAVISTYGKNSRGEATFNQTFWGTWACTKVFFGMVIFMTAGKR